MSTWFYYDSNNQKQGPVTGGQLKGLAKTGQITPETVVETEEGKNAPARKVKGLTFIAAVQPQTTPPPPPVELNPFSATPPDSANPFSAAPPDAAKTSAVSVSEVDQPIPLSTSTSFVEKIKSLRWYHWIGIVLVLGIIGAIVDKSDKKGDNNAESKQSTQQPDSPEEALLREKINLCNVNQRSGKVVVKLSEEEKAGIIQ
jgi:hypothetical protein